MNTQPRFSVVVAALVLGSLAPASSRAQTPDAGVPVRPAPARPSPAPPSGESREKLEGAKLDPLLGEIARARKGVRTLQASFTQERKLTLLATTVKSTGEFTFVAPDRLRWELAPPDDIVYFIGPEGISYRTRSSKATLPPRSGNIAKALADLRALLGDDLSLLRDRYVLSGERGKDDVVVAGTAKDKSASVRGFRLVLDNTLVLPMKATLIEGKSDAIEITFSNAQVNVPIDPAKMRP